MYKNILISVICLVLFGCKANEAPNYISDTRLEVSFSHSSADRRLNLSEFTDSVEYIPIENDGSRYPVSNAMCVKYIGDKFYVQDAAQRLHVISKAGKIICQLSAIGRARNEYVSLGRFDVNPANSQISVYDNACRKINIYSADAGFIRSISLDNDGLIDDFAVLPNGDHLMYQETYHSDEVRRGLRRTDSLGHFKTQHFAISNDFKYSSGQFPYAFQHVNDTVVCLKGHQDKDFIYHITNDTVVAAYQLVFDVSFPDEVKKSMYADDNMRRKFAGKIYDKTDCLENDKWLYVTATNGLTNVALLYNKLTKERFVFNQEDAEDMIVNDIDFPVNIMACGNNHFVGLFQPETFESIPHLKELFPHLSQNSNPIIALYY